MLLFIMQLNTIKAYYMNVEILDVFFSNRSIISFTYIFNSINNIKQTFPEFSILSTLTFK